MDCFSQLGLVCHACAPISYSWLVSLQVVLVLVQRLSKSVRIAVTDKEMESGFCCYV